MFVWLSAFLIVSVISAAPIFPLPHPYHGCPRIVAFYSGLSVNYEAVSSTSWQSGSSRIYAQSLDPTNPGFLKCHSADYDIPTRKCTANTSSIDSLVCLFADNYCPSVTVAGNAQADLNGTWLQTGNSTWALPTATCDMAIEGRDVDGLLTYTCGGTSIAAAEATCRELHSLVEGQNTLAGFPVYYIPTGPNMSIDTKQAKAFQVWTLDSGYGATQRIWICSSNPMDVDSAVVVTTASYMNLDPVFVNFLYVDEATSLIKLSTCAGSAGKELVNLAFVKKGFYSPDSNNAMYAGLIDVTEGVETKATITPTLPAVPFVLSQLQSSSVPLLQSRVIASTVDSTTLFLEADTRTVGSTPGTGVAGYVAVSFVGKVGTGLYGPDMYYQVIRSSSAVDDWLVLSYDVQFQVPPLILAAPSSQTSDSVTVQWEQSLRNSGEVYVQSAACGVTSANSVNVDMLALGPIDPAPVPTEPVIPPTDPVIPPTDPVIPPTDPVIPPTDPVIPPTDPVIPPTDPVIPPTDPVIPPTDPVIPPTDPVIPPTDPVIPPTDPVIPPTDPAGTPAPDATTATVAPTAPATTTTSSAGGLQITSFVVMSMMWMSTILRV